MGGGQFFLFKCSHFITTHPKLMLPACYKWMPGLFVILTEAQRREGSACCCPSGFDKLSHRIFKSLSPPPFRGRYGWGPVLFIKVFTLYRLTPKTHAPSPLQVDAWLVCHPDRSAAEGRICLLLPKRLRQAQPSDFQIVISSP